MKKNKHSLLFRIPKRIHEQMLEDLKRPHEFAAERVGFLFTISKQINENTTLIIAQEYKMVADNNYIDDPRVGAKIGSRAIRGSMQEIFNRKGGCFHVHLHDHRGIPSPSFTDSESLPGIADSFANIGAQQANGFIILSEDSIYASVKLQKKKHLVKPTLISVVGDPMHLVYPGQKRLHENPVYNRQSFLGESAQFHFENIKVAIIGYGGGGSHIGQQLAHIGVRNVVIFDDDAVEDSNMNRLVGAWFRDVKNKMLKTSIAKRVIKKILPKANVVVINDRWQNRPDVLQSCDIVLGCVDSYAEREQLEAECRRYLIPLIDIGMDVHQSEDQLYSMSGQIILSMPGCSCMRCFGFLTEKKLAQEAAKYGKVGGRPQVVWPNGVLASTAVGVFVDLVTGWTRTTERVSYLSYDGNTGIINEHVRLRFAAKSCDHYSITETGPAMFKTI
jgi:hypothetical protein